MNINYYTVANSNHVLGSALLNIIAYDGALL